MLGIKNKFRTMLRIDEIQVWLNEKEEKLDLYDKYHNKRKLSKYFLFVALFDVILMFGLSISLSWYDSWQNTAYFDFYLVHIFFDVSIILLLVFFVVGMYFLFSSSVIFESKNAGEYLDGLASFSEVKIYSEIQQHLIAVDKLIQQLKDGKKWKNDEHNGQEERT